MVTRGSTGRKRAPARRLVRGNGPRVQAFASSVHEPYVSSGSRQGSQRNRTKCSPLAKYHCSGANCWVCTMQTAHAYQCNDLVNHLHLPKSRTGSATTGPLGQTGCGQVCQMLTTSERSLPRWPRWPRAEARSRSLINTACSRHRQLKSPVLSYLYLSLGWHPLVHWRKLFLQQLLVAKYNYPWIQLQFLLHAAGSQPYRLRSLSLMYGMGI